MIHNLANPVGGRKVFGLTGLCIKDRLQAEDFPVYRVGAYSNLSLSEIGSIAPIQQ